MIELVLILVIIGILSAYAIPRFFNPTAFNERFYYDSVKSLLRSAQKMSIASGCHTQVNATTNNIHATQRASCTTGGFTISIQAITVSDDIALTTNNFPIYFNSLGQAINSTNDVVTDGSININSRTITIVGNTGLIYNANN